jgi:hypothetical protein
MTRHQHNRQFFDKLTSESCYWAGFVAADGNIDTTNGGVIIALSEKDAEHLEKFRLAISSTSPILRRDTSNGYREARLSIYGARECQEALYASFSVTPRKSLTLRPPHLEQEEYIRSFIRGYMDGDGSISKTGKNDHWQVGFLGTKEVLEWIKLQLQKYVKKIGNPSVLPDRRVFQIVFQCEQTRHILDWIYKDSSTTTRLDRKYDRYTKVCSRY